MLRTSFINRHLGIEVEYLDLKTLTPSLALSLKELLALYGLILVRNQILDDRALTDLARLMGDGRLEPSARKISHSPIVKDVAYMTNLRDPQGEALGFPGDTTDFWHADQEFREHPASLGILFCLIPAESGGATSFASTAVENVGISDDELQVLRGLRSTRRPALAHDNAPQITISHAAIQTNPLTHKDYLYVSENALEFVGQSPEQSQHLKHDLLARILRPENLYAHQWRAGDVVLYDNTQSLHRREAFTGLRFLKALKIYPDREYFAAPVGHVIT